eukprot:CAMPEP_0117440544 /NCGR_PEP_ID=MMETSP0759-20121206/3152_1 /TAXON_ID=63605 /ORGANISM="Percolomonas cosmopolitus, Strain WS" /LENGTH=179 /DNA_ID=CAMNT_0005232327 /DNA_START=1047 /DNA_END=1586 /DNA_ORIENTATION=+
MEDAGVLENNHLIYRLTLRRWSNKGHVDTLATPGGIRLYNIKSAKRALGIQQTRDSQEEKGSKKKSATLASVASTKRATSRGKSKTSKRNAHSTGSSKTLDLDSIGNEEGSSKFWTPFSREVSQNLSSATAIDCVDLDSTSWNTSAKSLAQNSWFSMRIQETHNTKNPNKNSDDLLAVV